VNGRIPELSDVAIERMLADRARSEVPPGLVADIVGSTAATRQRRALPFVAVSRWLPEGGRLVLLAAMLALVVLAGVALLVGALRTGPQPLVVVPAPSTLAVVEPTATETPTPAPAPTPQPSSSEPDRPRADTGAYAAGDVLVVVADGLRVRSQPRVADDSRKFTPLLSARDPMVVLDGPVSASGYDWYRVLPFDRASPVGWVAAASRDGAPWVARGRGACDATAPSVTTIAQTTPGSALGCYGNRPLTFEAQIMDCMSDVEAIPTSPAWFSLMTLTIGNDRVCPVLVEPGSPSVVLSKALFLHLDPEGEAPDPLPLGVRVQVSGQFDHPAAQQCESGWLDDPVLTCRTTFVVTRVVVAS